MWLITNLKFEVKERSLLVTGDYARHYYIHGGVKETFELTDDFPSVAHPADDDVVI